MRMSPEPGLLCGAFHQARVVPVSPFFQHSTTDPMVPAALATARGLLVAADY
jgi:hypothetical protein